MTTITTNKFKTGTAFVLATAVCFSLMAGLAAYPQLRVSSAAGAKAPGSVSANSTRNIPADLKDVSQVKNEAALYDTAMREISQLSSSSLATIDDLKKANAVLERQIPNLRYSRSKLAAVGLSDSTFVAAVKAHTSGKKATEDFASELGKDPNAILKLNGATSLGDRIARSLETDTTTLRQAAERLKQAAGDIKAKLKTNHARAGNRSAPPAIETSWPVPFAGLTKDQQVVLLVGVAVLVCSPLLPLLVTVSQGVLAVALIGQLIANFGTEQGRDKVAACMDDAEHRYRNCSKDAATLCCGLDSVARALCAYQWMLDAAVCLIS